MIRLLRLNDIILLVYKRYDDDINREDQQIMDKIREIGNTIHKSIELETDTQAKHKERKMPVLDLKVWDETRKD